MYLFFFFFSSRRRHTRWTGDWSSDVCSSDLGSLLFKSGSFPEIERASYLFPTLLTYLYQKFRGQSFESYSKDMDRSEERRVGKECRCRWWTYHEKKKE